MLSWIRKDTNAARLKAMVMRSDEFKRRCSGAMGRRSKPVPKSSETHVPRDGLDYCIAVEAELADASLFLFGG